MAFNTWTNIKVNKNNIKPISIKDLSSCKNNYVFKGSRFIQILKVSLANANYETVIKFVCNSKVIKLFRKQDIYIHDIDFTRDYQGVFNKTRTIRFLQDKHGFRKEGEENYYYDETAPTIINNVQKVGRKLFKLYYYRSK